MVRNSLLPTRSARVRESLVESHLREATEARGGKAKKLTSDRGYGENDWPDRLLVLPRGRIVFVETKATGKKARRAQKRNHDWLIRRGHLVLVVDRVEDIPAVFEAIELLW